MEPPPDAFEPQPGDATGESTFRRRLRIAVTLTVVAALIVLAAVEGGGYIIRRGTVESTPVPSTPVPATARLAVIDVAGAPLGHRFGLPDGVAIVLPIVGNGEMGSWSP